MTILQRAVENYTVAHDLLVGQRLKVRDLKTQISDEEAKITTMTKSVKEAIQIVEAALTQQVDLTKSWFVE